MALNSKPYYWRSRKAWYLHVVGANGKRTKVKLADKRTEAFQEYEKYLLAAKNTATSEATDDPLFSKISEAWLNRQEQRLAQGDVSPAWLARSLATIDRFNEAYPNQLVSQMTPAFVQSWLKSPKANYERTELSTLKQCLKWAVREANLIARNPLESLALPGMTRKEGILSAEDQAKVLAVAKHLRPLLEVAWLTGCRPGELRALQWSHLSDDLSQATLQAHKTKKSSGRPRLLIFSEAAREILAKQSTTSDFVFLNSRGKPWTKNAVVLAVKQIRLKTGVQLTAGMYRHTFATSALTNGVPVATVAQLLGHSSTAMVSRVYGHLAEKTDYLKRAAQLAAVSVSPAVDLPQVEKPDESKPA